MLAAFTFSRISFGPGVGIGSFRNFITSREPNLSIMTTSISAMKHPSDLLQFQIVREARTFLRNLESRACCPRTEHLHGIDETSPSRRQFKGSQTGCRAFPCAGFPRCCRLAGSLPRAPAITLAAEIDATI